MLLYYCTICALYPSLYARSLPSSCSLDSEQNENDLLYLTNSDEKNEKQNKKSFKIGFDFQTKNDLETTSEGLCDHIREIFNINRQIFNEYQVKAMKKILSKKSHPQVSFH